MTDWQLAHHVWLVWTPGACVGLCIVLATVAAGAWLYWITPR